MLWTLQGNSPSPGQNVGNLRHCQPQGQDKHLNIILVNGAKGTSRGLQGNAIRTKWRQTSRTTLQTQCDPCQLCHHQLPRDGVTMCTCPIELKGKGGTSFYLSFKHQEDICCQVQDSSLSFSVLSATDERKTLEKGKLQGNGGKISRGRITVLCCSEMPEAGPFIKKRGLLSSPFLRTKSTALASLGSGDDSMIEIIFIAEAHTGWRGPQEGAGLAYMKCCWNTKCLHMKHLQ